MLALPCLVLSCLVSTISQILLAFSFQLTLSISIKISISILIFITDSLNAFGSTLSFDLRLELIRRKYGSINWTQNAARNYNAIQYWTAIRFAPELLVGSLTIIPISIGIATFKPPSLRAPFSQATLIWLITGTILVLIRIKITIARIVMRGEPSIRNIHRCLFTLLQVIGKSIFTKWGRVTMERRRM